MKNFDTKFYYELTEIALSFAVSVFFMLLFIAFVNREVTQIERVIILICPNLIYCIWRVKQLIKNYL